jgi:heavy metal sensor kinase
MALILGLYAAGVFAFLAHSLRQELDYRLHEDFELAESALEVSNGSEVRWRLPEHADEDAGSGFLEVWSKEGKLLYRKSDLEKPVAEQLSKEISSGARGYTSVFVSAVGHFRVLSGDEELGGSRVLLRVTRSEEPMREKLRQLFLVLGLGIPAALGAAAFGGYALARRALRPVQEMATQARSITAERLGQRLPVSSPDDELGLLAIVFNETLARLEKSFDQLRRFTADVSHELRTPLTAIRSVGEVGLREERDAKAYREVIGSMLEEADRLTRLVDTLLSLARADSGHVKLAREPVDIAEMAREAVGYLSPLAEEKQQTLSVEAGAPIPATIDRLVIRQAVVNLIDNAIKYSPAGSAICVRARHSDSEAILEVLDSGPGIAPEHRERVFDRFYRIDKARSNDLGGSGLGLALARWAVEAHDGRIELESELGKGSTFRIVLPTSRGDSV